MVFDLIFYYPSKGLLPKKAVKMNIVKTILWVTFDFR